MGQGLDEEPEMFYELQDIYLILLRHKSIEEYWEPDEYQAVIERSLRYLTKYAEGW